MSGIYGFGFVLNLIACCLKNEFRRKYKALFILLLLLLLLGKEWSNNKCMYCMRELQSCVKLKVEVDVLASPSLTALWSLWTWSNIWRSTLQSSLWIALSPLHCCWNCGWPEVSASPTFQSKKGRTDVDVWSMKCCCPCLLLRGEMESPDWCASLFNICLQRHLWLYCPGHAGVQGKGQANRLGGGGGRGRGGYLPKQFVFQKIWMKCWGAWDTTCVCVCAF